ncbi:MAG: hypothetical protein Fur0021_31000 [Candidatus Promineifilaceae bacterium]
MKHENSDQWRVVSGQKRRPLTIPQTNFVLWLLGAALLFCLLVGWQTPLFAQTATPTAAPTPAANVASFTLADLGYSAEVMLSPLDEILIPFSTPKDWSIRGEASTITLQYDIFYGGNLAPGASLPPELAEARIDVTLNGVALASFTPYPTAGGALRLPIPYNAVLDPEANDHTLRLTLYAGPNCTLLDSIRFVLYENSQIDLAYAPLPPVTDLSTFPRPLWRERLTPEISLIVLPDAYSDADLSAAAAVAAAIGQQTDGAVQTELTTAGALTSEQLASNDIVAVGQPQQNAFIAGLYAQGALPTRLAAQPVEIAVDAAEDAYRINVQALLPAAELAGSRLVAEIPAFHQVTTCDSDCFTNGRLIVWDLPASGALTTTLQINLNDQPVVAAQTPITLTLVNSAGGPLYVRSSAADSVAATDGGSVLYDAGRAILYPDDGLLQIIPSPTSADHVVLVITGASDAGVSKAARALSSGEPILSFGGSVAVIRAVRPAPSAPTALEALPETFTLADLGYRGAILEGVGRKTSSVSFEMPANWVIQPGASLTLNYLQSATLNPTLSGLTVELNGNPVGGAPASPTGGGQQLVIPLAPADFIPGGSNRLRFIAVMDMNDPCLPGNTPLAWTRIDSASQLTLPRQTLTTTAAPAGDLGDVLFVLPAAPAATDLNALARLANKVGQDSIGAGLRPQVVRAVTDAIAADAATLSQNTVVAVGRPTTNTFIASQNEALPQPFLPGSDALQETVGSVVYRLGADASLGIIQVMPAPWAPNRDFVLISGVTDEGVEWASRAYADPLLAAEIEGNVTLVQGERIVSFNTALEHSGDLISAISNVTQTTAQIELVTPTATTAVAVVSTPSVTAPPTPVPASVLPERYAPPASELSPAMWGGIIGLLVAGVALAVGGAWVSWRRSRQR